MSLDFSTAMMMFFFGMVADFNNLENSFPAEVSAKDIGILFAQYGDM